MEKSIDYYLTKGFEPKMAAYFASGRRKITSVTPHQDYTLSLSFDNGEERIFDAAPLLQDGTVFSHFQRWEDFRRVYLDEDHCVSWDIDPAIDSRIEWNNKVDLCPDTCYVDSIPVSGSKSL